MRLAPVLWFLFALAVGLVLGGTVASAPPLPAVLHDTLYITRTQVVRSAPRVEQRIVDRIIYREVPPELVMVGRDSVPVDSTAVIASDATPSRADAKPVQPTLPYLAGRYDHGRLELWAQRSDGSVLYERRGVHVPFDFVTDSAKLHVHEQRAWLRILKGAAKCGGAAAIGAGVGALVVGRDRMGGAIAGAVTGCGATILF